MQQSKISFTKSLSIIILPLVLAGCLSTQSTMVYGPRAKNGVGYQDRQIGENKYEIQIIGYATTPHSQLEDFFHKRAEELCDGPDSYISNIGANTVKGRTQGYATTYSWSGPQNYQQSIVTGVATCK